ncbi:glycoside hydrolase family 3 C-terminal domain-containing protein [Silvibacterium sp.]|uniref:glycoside hydrolase family 3 C-terminal domain-containing protein n=1 Tax=Silvibacterium sp. TaxID=1964179 RepID=UPI0039E6F6D4
MTLEEKIDCLSTNTAIPRLGVKSFGSSEGIHGVVQRGNEEHHREPIYTTQFPQPPGMGETWDPDLVRQAAAVEGSEARYISEQPRYDHPIYMLWGPQADLARDPRWGRSEEVYGEDPFFNGTMVVNFVHGLQGDDPNHWQAAALLKHFLANSNEDLRTKSDSVFDARLFWEYYSVPFRMGFVDGGARGVMASYNAWNSTPMAVNPILKSIVEDQWGVDVLSSDGGAVKLLWTDHKRFPDQKAAVIACLHAGINQFLDTYKDETMAAVKEGSVTEAEIDGLLRRKFVISLKLGLLNPGQEFKPALNTASSDAQPPAGVPASANQQQASAEQTSPEPWNSDEHHAVSQKMALESVVLLKNENNALPLDKKAIKSIAVIGPLADSVHWDWYGGYPPYAVTPLDGIKAAVGPYVRVNYAASEANQAAIDAARQSDVAIVVVGNDPTCGPDMARDWHATVDGGGTLPCTVPSDGREGRDRETLTLEQEQLVKQVYAVNPHTVMVLISSFPYTINWSEQYLPAILHMTHASQDEGTALAKVLFGDYNPAGRLVTTWPSSLDQLPPMMDYNIRDGRTYMYFKDKPLYPFGYGLSYTTFRYSNLRLSKASLHGGEELTATVDVTNTGSRDGDEVVQLYISHLNSKVPRAKEELKGFRRVPVPAGQTVSVQIALKASDLAYWNEKENQWALEGDRVDIRIGASSADIRLHQEIPVQP